MRRRFYHIVFIAAVLLNPFRLNAQGNAGQAGEFLRWGVGSKALGLGRAFTSVADDASALYWNPAGLSALSRLGGSFMVMHVPMREGASFNYLAGAIPLRLFFVNSEENNGFINVIQDLKLGVGVLWHSLGEFEFYNEDGSKASDQSGNTIGQSAIYLSASYPLTWLFKGWGRGPFSALRGDLHVGLTTKIVRQDLFGFAGNATSLDLGLKYKHHTGVFNLGFAWRDLNQSTISYEGNIVGDQIPSTGILGFSVKPPIGFMHGLLFSFDYGVIKHRARDRDFMVGVEYDLARVNAQLPIKLRFGANSNYESISFGLSFSPESLFGQDWVPSGDYSFTNGRSGFDAAGAGFSISVDRNPFTAKYWYQKAMQYFPDPELTDEEQTGDPSTSLRYLSNAKESKNPGNRAYRYEATLRQGDLTFLKAITEFRAARMDDMVVATEATETLKGALALYTSKSSKYLSEDYGKTQIDLEAYFKSFIYHVQGLIFSDHPDQASDLCTERGRSWGKMIDVVRGGNGHYDEWMQRLYYLQAFALYKRSAMADAKALIRSQLSENSLARYILGHMAFLDEEYEVVLEVLRDLDLNDTQYPAHLFLPLAGDRTFGDEVLFLKAASIFKISGVAAADEFINEFAKIPRFLPHSDLASFLTSGGAPFFKILESYEKHDEQELIRLVSKMIESYIRTFSNGNLKKDLYTHNFGG
ncbi:hypothetical protein MJD09_26970 [bacterium]|nr:hypothetical protein [bacterium]